MSIFILIIYGYFIYPNLLRYTPPCSYSSFSSPLPSSPSSSCSCSSSTVASCLSVLGSSLYECSCPCKQGVILTFNVLFISSILLIYHNSTYTSWQQGLHHFQSSLRSLSSHLRIHRFWAVDVGTQVHECLISFL